MQTPGQIEAEPVFAATEAFGCTSSKDFAEYVHLGAGGGLECRDHRVEGIVFRGNEALPAHHGKLRTLSAFQGADCAHALAKSNRAGPVSAPVAASAVPP